MMNLKQLSYISSAGIGAIMSLLQRLRRSSGNLALLNPSQKVYKILDLLGFTEMFKIIDNEAAAVEALKEGLV